MKYKQLLKLIEDEVASVVRTPLKEPEADKPKPKYKPVLQNDEEIELYLFYGGHKPKEEDLDDK